MKRKLTIMAAVVLTTLCALAVMPKQEVKANCYTDMTYEQVVQYWAAQAAFAQIYGQELGCSAYGNADIYNYFMLGLRDYCFNPAYLQAYCPLTYAYMAGVLGYSNPNIYNYVVYGNYAGPMYSLYSVIQSEVNSFMAYYSPIYRDRAVATIMSYLGAQGVYTVGQYDDWKAKHGGLTAYQVYINTFNAWDLWVDTGIAAATNSMQAYNQNFINTAMEQKAQMEAAAQSQVEKMNEMMSQQAAIMGNMFN